MSPGMHALQVADRDLCIACRGAEIGVTEDRLKMPHIGPVVQHVRRHGMSQQMTGPALGESRPCHSATNQVAQPMPDVRLTGVAEECGLRRFGGHQKRPNFLQVAPHPVGGSPSHGDIAALATLAVADKDDA